MHSSVDCTAFRLAVPAGFPHRWACSVPSPLESQGFESLRSGISTSIIVLLHADFGRFAHPGFAQRFGLFGRAISTRHSITTDRASTLHITRSIPAKPCQTKRPACFVWSNARCSPVRCTAIRLVGCVSYPHTGRRQAHETRRAFRMRPPRRVSRLRPVVCSRNRIGPSRSEFTKIHAWPAIRLHAHLLLSQRFASFCALVIHMRRPLTSIASQVTWSNKSRESRPSPAKRRNTSTSRAGLRRQAPACRESVSP